MEFRLPERSDEQALAAYVAEHREHGETFIHASLGLADTDYPAWLEQIRRNATEGSERWGRSLVELCLEEDRIVGLVRIGYEMPEDLSEVYGHIGYGVRPCARRQGYGTEILRHALEVCREHGLTQVTLGCFHDNLASAATIRRCSGVLIAESDNVEPGGLSQYYAIGL